VEISTSEVCIRGHQVDRASGLLPDLHTFSSVCERGLSVTQERVEAAVIGAHDAEHQEVVVLSGSLNCVLVPLHGLGGATYGNE
jgi:hypothetical protein